MERRSLEDDLTHPVLAEFYAYWRSLGSPGRLPVREDLDITNLGRVLSDRDFVARTGVHAQCAARE